ncbi:hypothetical protein CYY_005985 [Polysphondylium violaceum]|uniref:E3 ubiquitin-protein ligase n=1 Tax=Polysphondylium violaceum TaxID=133409 RepID=A0A8J4UYG1_9MYCE|nr:hypothetical protein CYY_005985 [Polysphondylium violaceum]
MGNTITHLNTNQSDNGCSKFKIEMPPTYQEVLQRLKNTAMTEDLLENLFKECCFMSVDSFFDKYPSNSTLKCQFQSKNQSEWFFRCNTCSLAENSCYCADCFFNGNHIELNHEFLIFESKKSAVCDCGNSEAFKSFCTKHVNANKPVERVIPQFVKRDLHIFFRYIFTYLLNIVSSALYDGSDKAQNEKDIKVVVEWLILLATESSILIDVISQEISSQGLDSAANAAATTTDNQMSLYNPLPLPFVEDRNRMSSLSETKHFLVYVFKDIALLDIFLDLLTLLLDNHRHFKIVFFEEYLKNYVDIFMPRDHDSSQIMTLIGSNYNHSNSVLVPFATGFSRFNYLDLILRTHKVYMPILEPFYKVESVISKEVMLQSDMAVFENLCKEEKVATYLLDHPEIFNQVYEVALALHKFISNNFVDPCISTTRFLLSLEGRLYKSITLMIKTLNNRDNFAQTTILPSIIKEIKKIPSRELVERCGFQLPHIDFFIKFKYNEIPIHFSLYRMLSVCMLEGKIDVAELKTRLSTVDVVNMVTTILLFRICYISYDPSADSKNKTEVDNELVTDYSLMCDLHLLQLSVDLLGPKYFLYAFFNIVTSVDTYNDTTAYNEIFALLISVLQIRPFTFPTEEQSKFHLIQSIASSKFSMDTLKTFDRILPHFNPPDEIPMIESLCSNFQNITKSLKDDLWDLYDPYYPFFALKYKNLIKSACKEKFKAYQATKNIPESFPLPPNIPPLAKNLEKVNQIFDESTLFECAFCILLQTLHHGFVGYDNSFELEPILQMLLPKPSFVTADFIYLVVLGIKTFKQVTYPNLSQQDKDFINQSIEAFFALPDKSQEQLEYKFEHTYSILNLIKVYNVELVVGEKSKLSLLDLFFEMWETMKKSTNLENRPSILFIFESLIDFHPSFAQHLKNRNINLIEDTEESKQDEINQKKSLAEKREKFLLQMKQQQQFFLQSNQALMEELEEDDEKDENNGEEDEKEEEKVEEEKENEDVEKENEEVEKENEEVEKEEDKLENEQETNNVDDAEINKEEQLEKKEEPIKVDVVKDETHDHHHDHHQHKKAEIEPESEEEKEELLYSLNNYMDDCIVCKSGQQEGPLFSIGYIDIVSLIDQTKNQRVESILLDPNVPDAYKDFLEEFHFYEICPSSVQYLPSRDDLPSLFAFFLFHRSASTYITSCHHNIHKKCLYDFNATPYAGFNCPLCSTPSNIVIPIGPRKDPIVAAQDRNDFYLNLCKFDFFLFMTTPEKSMVIERYMWKFVIQNIETLEIKTRKTTMYNSSASDAPYYLMKQSEFNKELMTSKKVYDVIMACNVSPGNFLPTSDPLIMMMDPFIVATYTTYLTNSGLLTNITSGIVLHFFSCLLTFFMHENPTTCMPMSKETLTTLINTFVNTPWDNRIEAFLINLALPFLRKVVLLHFLVSPPPKEFTLEQFSDMDFITRLLFTSPFEKVFKSQDYLSLLDVYCETKFTPKGCKFEAPFVYPPPMPFNHMPRFIDIPEKFVDFMRQIGGHCETCHSLLKACCLFCGDKFCTTDNCKGSSYIHSYRCPNTPFGLFLEFDKPALVVLKEVHGKTCSTSVYDIYFKPNGEISPIPDSTLRLSKEKLKNVYKNWMNCSNSRKFENK